MLKSSSLIRVRYADTDKMQVVYNAKYFEYFEVGRTDMLRNLGLPYSTVEKMGYLLPVLECSAKFIKSAIYDDVLRIETEMPELPKPFLMLYYKVYHNDENTLLAEGFTRHIFTSVNGLKPLRPIPEFMEKIKSYYQ